MKCDTCTASKKIKDGFVCNSDQLFNRVEIFKSEIAKIFKLKYKPKFQCRVEDLVELEKEHEKSAKEYIDRENYCDSVCKCDKEYCDKTRCNIWRVPAADVAEVLHGEWKIGTVHPHNHEIASFVCTACRGLSGKDSNYCPNCGAKMDGKEGAENAST